MTGGWGRAGTGLASGREGKEEEESAGRDPSHRGCLVVVMVSRSMLERVGNLAPGSYPPPPARFFAVSAERVMAGGRALAAAVGA